MVQVVDDCLNVELPSVSHELLNQSTAGRDCSSVGFGEYGRGMATRHRQKEPRGPSGLWQNPVIQHDDVSRESAGV